MVYQYVTTLYTVVSQDAMDELMLDSLKHLLRELELLYAYTRSKIHRKWMESARTIDQRCEKEGDQTLRNIWES